MRLYTVTLMELHQERFHVKMKSSSLPLYPARDAVNYIWHARTFVRWEQASDRAARLNNSQPMLIVHDTTLRQSATQLCGRLGCDVLRSTGSTLLLLNGTR